METTLATYEDWLAEVKAALASINMPLEVWQAAVPFDFTREFIGGVAASAAATKANRFWWREQNRRINENCRATAGCWLPRGHTGGCDSV